ncbi:MAG: hypothetical protein IJH67_14895 [Thermoguttaceae bacterium]|nr:hypothetical protein [Thermoguttaceae bacterium]
MLNELYSLKKSLVQSGQQLTGHPDINDFSQRDGITVIVGEDGSLEIKSIGTTQNKWRYNPDNQLSFPASKIFGPLIQPKSLPQSFIANYKDFIIRKSKERKKEELQKLENSVFEEFISMIKNDCFAYEVTDDSQILKKFEKSWTSAAQSVSEIFGDRLVDVNPVYHLVEALKKSATDKEQTIREKVHSFIDAIVEAVRKGRIKAGLAIKLFLGKYNPKTDSWDKSEEIWIYFNVVGDGIELSREAFRKLLVQIESEQAGIDVEKLPICALTGEHQHPVKGKFPQVKVPVFQQKTSLLAMNKDVFCHDRYGKIAADICNVGQETANQLALALGFITNEEQKGRTWESIISDNEKKSDLLIVYFEPNPTKNNADLATLLNNYRKIGAGYSDNNDSTDVSSVSSFNEDFARKTEAVIKLLSNEVHETLEEDTIKCLILRELDPGRRQLLYSDSFTVAQLQEDALFWQRGSKNVPEIKFWIFKDNQYKNPVLQGVTPISFEDAQELFRKKWIRGGTESCSVPGVSRAEIFALFLRRYHDAKREVYVLLSHLLENCEELLIYIGGKNGLKKGNDSSKKDKKKENDQRICTLQCIAMLGILLKNLNSEKEVYMNKTPFNLGRLLALADQLHIFYCQDVRGGDIPSSLIGNALIPLAKTNPAQALIRLGDRLPIYMAWAKKYINSKKSEDNAKKPTPGYVVWVMNEMDHVSKAIEESDEQLTEKFSDIEAAQFLLGYLAMYKGKTSQNSDEVQDETEESEKQLD